MIRAVLESGRTVTFAVKRVAAPDDASGEAHTTPFDLPALRFPNDRQPDEWLFDEDELVET